jgi:hypothetical protein
MMETPTRVAIVVELDFSGALEQLAERMHVWVVDTPPNRAIAEKVWGRGSGDRTHGITTFDIDATAAPEMWVVEFLNTVDEHHGLRAEWASDVELEVWGVGLTANIRGALQELGPFTLEE